jgi:hypothetical protein
MGTKRIHGHKPATPLPADVEVLVTTKGGYYPHCGKLISWHSSREQALAYAKQANCAVFLQWAEY